MDFAEKFPGDRGTGGTGAESNSNPRSVCRCERKRRGSLTRKS